MRVASLILGVPRATLLLGVRRTVSATGAGPALAPRGLGIAPHRPALGAGRVQNRGSSDAAGQRRAVPPAPSPARLWIRGCWIWNGNTWVRVQDHWARA
jgi:hypothetical protein